MPSVDVLKPIKSPFGEYLDFPIVPRDSPEKPNKAFYVSQLAKGMAVGVHRVGEYPVFFKLFDRYVKKHRLKLKLAARQKTPDLWLLIPHDPKGERPSFELRDDSREHGRFKFYASELRSGKTLVFKDESFAARAKRAFHLYTPKQNRQDSRVVITKDGRGTFLVSVEKRVTVKASAKSRKLVKTSF